jgi:hypothetical protein
LATEVDVSRSRAIPVEPVEMSAAPRALALAPTCHGTLLWLAAADARGHLMRAHLVRAALASRGIAVNVVTTSHEGRAFLAALGTPSEVLSSGYAVAFDAAQNMDRAATEACIARYFLSPEHAAHDFATLRRLARGADLVVNDFHPLPLVAPRSLGAPVVHVYGTHLWGAIAHHFEGRAPRAFDRLGATFADRLRRRALGCIEHSLLAPSGSSSGLVNHEARAPEGRAGLVNHEARAPEGRAGLLPPVVAAPARTRAQVRAAMGLGNGRQRLAAVYLNPHFRDARLAAALEGAFERRGFRMHAVGEGFAGRPGWRPYDRAFNDVAAAADVLVSAPGMGALSAWAHFGTPLLAVRTDQPEQAANLRDVMAVRAAPCAVVDAAEATPERLDAALADLTEVIRGPRPDPAAAAAAVQARWADSLCTLLSRSRQPLTTHR